MPLVRAGHLEATKVGYEIDEGRLSQSRRAAGLPAMTDLPSPRRPAQRRARRAVRAIGAALLAMTLIAATGLVLDEQAPARTATRVRAVGVTLETGPGGPQEAFELFTRAGANALEAPQPWSTLEPAPGRFRLGDVESIVRGVRSTPATRVMLIPAAIETSKRSVPADLRRAAWDSDEMISRYQALMRRAAHHASRQVAYVSIANEADVYFSAHPQELPAFTRFAQAQLRELRRLMPWARIGVTVTYTGLTSPRPAIARALARLGDATILTYYPLGDGYRPRSPRAPLTDLPRMVRLAHGRPLVLQEAGYPSAGRLHSSPAAQATFVRNVFAAWQRHPRAIPMVSFYTLFDLPATACRREDELDQMAFVCSLGLRTRDGHAKPAWNAFTAGVSGVR
jgi:hypothetical protein